MLNEHSLRKIILDLLLKAGPIFLIYASNTLTFNVKRIWLSKLGADALEAHIIARTIAELLTLPAPLLISQTPIKVAELFGEIKAKKNLTAVTNDVLLGEDTVTIDSENIEPVVENDEVSLQQTIGDIMRQGYILSILASLPVMGILIATKTPWINTFGSSEKISKLAVQYLLAYGSVITSEYINTMTEGVLSAVDQEKWIILLRVLSSAIDIGLAAVLIPRYSLAGDVYATLARNMLGVVISTLLFKFYPPLKKYNVFDFRWGSFEKMREILKESWPYSLYQLAQSGTSYLLSIFMGKLGNGRLTAYQVPNSLFGMAMSINTALSISANRIIAQHFGSNNFNTMFKIGNISLISNSLIYSTNALGINLLHRQLAGLFLSKEDLSSYASMLKYNFMILAIVNVAQMLFDNASQLLAATDDTIFSSLVWLISTLVLTLPLSAIVTYLTKFDIYGVGAAIGIGALVSAMPTLFYWHKRSSRIIETDNHVASSNNALTDWVSSKLGFFSCGKKYISLDNDDNTENTEQTFLVSDGKEPESYGFAPSM